MIPVLSLSSLYFVLTTRCTRLFRNFPLVTCMASCFQNVINFSLVIGPAPFLVISLEHPGCEELIGRAVLWERVTKVLGEPMT